VQQHLERQSGVQKAVVSLRDGMVEVTPKEDGQIDPSQLLKATYDSGVTVAEMDMTATGRVTRLASGELSLGVAPNRSFVISPNEFSKQLESMVDSNVTVRGQLYTKADVKKKGQAPAALKLLILEIQKNDQTNNQPNDSKRP
jgi:hypothetical protein